MEVIKFGYKYFKKNMPLAIFAEFLSFVGIFAELMLPLLSGMFIDYAIGQHAVDEESGGVFHFLLTGNYGQVHTMKLFTSIAIVFAVMVATRVILIYVRDLIQEWIGLKLETDLREASYQKLMDLDSQTISDYNSGELLQILNSDTIMFKELFCHRLAYFGDAIFMFTVTLVIIARINLSFIIIPFILMPFIISQVMGFKRAAKENFKTIRDKSSALNLTTQENIAAVRIVRSFTNEELELNKFEKANSDFYNARLDQIWLSSRFDMVINTLKQIAYISTIVVGGYLAIKGRITVGYILASSTYVMRIMNNITAINNHIFNMQQQTVAGMEMKKFFEKESQIPDTPDAVYRSDMPNIKLENVCLNIDGKDILKDITIDIPYGKKVGIVGGTGSGKSILIKTLVRSKDITSGTITIDGHDIKEYSLKNLRDMYSYAFQDVFLFSNTIESNIAFSRPDVDAKLIREASSYAEASKFISQFSERYKTIVGERGLGISGGQKQRISLARAFLKNAPVFVLDDSTSALDVNTERMLLQNIRDNFADKTLIITAHRLSSVVSCDEIIYLHDGEIVERGSFEQLIEKKGYFYSVYNIQQEQYSELLDKRNGEEDE